ncbi:MAG: GNAT family N-acetyltransferase [Treponema sp.]|nr:GNAT family N-acetyltransferase [Treponema sp.]
MMQIKYVENEDKDFWFTLDKHLPESEFEKKVRDRQGYVLTDDGIKIGLLGYNLFWDSIPFCTMLFVDWTKQKKGYGRQLMQFWEDDMKVQGYGMTMTSTRVDENAQHFYRKLGYKDCGGFIMEIPGYKQPMEMLMTKAL